MANRVDPKSGFNPETKTYSSLRPRVPLPPPSLPLSLSNFALSLLRSSSAPLSATSFLIDASSARHVSYSAFLSQVTSLTSSLSSLISKSQVAYVISPASLHVPVLYFSLLSLGAVVSPANPASSASEIAYQCHLTSPAVAFATSATASKLPKGLKTILIDSPEFLSLFETEQKYNSANAIEVLQSDPAVILYSSGTTGRVKGVVLTHGNFIALIAGMHALTINPKANERVVSMFTLPLFHVFGFFMMVRAVAMGETLVLMERFDFEGMLKAVERFKVTNMPVSPPLVVALAKSELALKYDLSSLRLLGSGGAPLGTETMERFVKRFPNVEIVQGYGLTESAGGATRMVDAEEAKQFASVGRLAENLEAKIVDPETGESLPPGQRGELWLRGPTIMKGYVGNDEATAETLDKDGWLKTGDLCYFDNDGFMYIVDRLKELIKYKGYQVPPAELEHILQSHPDIADTAVIPYPDEDVGQIPMAYVVRKPGSNINEDGVMDFVAKKVASYKKIRRVAFVNSIPKSPAGKILRRELVTLALSSGSSKL